MIRTLVLLLLATLSSLAISTPIRSALTTVDQSNPCHLPSITGSYSQLNASKPVFTIEIVYVRLTMVCAQGGDGADTIDSSIAASLTSIRPSGQVWPPPSEVSLANVRFALAVLRGLLPSNNKDSAPIRLTHLSMAGLAALPGNAISTLATTLSKFVDLSMLNVSSIGATNLPSELLSLPRLRQIDAGGNPIDCSLPENRWLQLLTQLGSALVKPASLMSHCRKDDGKTSTSKFSVLNSLHSSSNANLTDLDDLNEDSPTQHFVDLHGEIAIPCSRRYFRSSDVGIWSSDATVVWRRLDPVGASLLLASIANSSLIYNKERNLSTELSASAIPKELGAQIEVGPSTLGAPLMIRGARLAVVGLWRCELVKAGIVAGVRHRVVLKPPLASLEIACYIVAASCSVAMVLIGLLAALIRLLVRTRCCTRVVHIVEAQSVHNLDASPLQTRRRRRQTIGDEAIVPDVSDAAPPADVAAAEAAWLDMNLCPADGPGPSDAHAGAHNIRDRMRDINDQLRHRVSNFGESVGSSMRAGWSSGVEHVKEQMRSVAEFCGVNNAPLGQTVSVVSVYADPEGRQEPLEQHLHLLSSV